MITTVGDLIDELSKYDAKLTVRALEVYDNSANYLDIRETEIDDREEGPVAYLVCEPWDQESIR